MEQGQDLRNTPWNIAGTFSLKALANKILERNKGWNNCGTAALNSVPLGSQSSSTCGTSTGCYKIEADDLLYEFNERVAIMEYDGGLTREQAERLAKVDIEENGHAS